MKKAMMAKMHLLPLRSLEGAMTRYHQVLTKRQLGEVRQQVAERKEKQKMHAQKIKKDSRGSRKGGTAEPWSPEEDAILWNSVQTRKPGVSVTKALEQIATAELLPGRSLSSTTNRYYVLAKKMEETNTAYIPPKEPEQQQQAPATMPSVTWRSRWSDPKPLEKPNPQQELDFIDVPDDEEPTTAVAAAPKLADKAEEFITSLYGVVQENQTLRKQVSKLNEVTTGAVEQLRKDLEAERNKTNRLLVKIAEMEEDRDSFLRLMDKARVIGREEIGVDK